LVYSGDYKLPGTILVTAIARDWHYGTAKASYTIKVKKPKQKKLKKSGRKITVRWKKLSHKYVTGYQVRYSTNSSMKNAKTKRVKKWSATKAKLKKLKKHRKYYVQVRSYVKINGIYYHSKWSKKKSIRL
jgi:hypothetical protein